MKDPLPERAVPWHVIWSWKLWTVLTWWPWRVRQLRQAGFRRTGWMTWEHPGGGKAWLG
jgi:hypothetical protein